MGEEEGVTKPLVALPPNTTHKCLKNKQKKSLITQKRAIRLSVPLSS